MARLYSAKEVAELTGVKANTLYTWLYNKYIIPELWVNKQREEIGFSLTDVKKVALLKSLTDAGMGKTLALKLIEKAKLHPKQEVGKTTYKFILNISTKDYDNL